MNLTYTVQITGDSNKEIGRIIREIAFGIRGEMQILMTGPKTGREYKRGSRVHVASAPGEPPAVDEGGLINSIEVPQSTITDTSATVVISAEYAEILEFEKDRPFVRPAINNVLNSDSGGFLGGFSD